jgi:hypothetical protein
MNTENENEGDAADRTSKWRTVVPLLSAAASDGDPVARADLDRLAEMGDAFPELLCTLALVLKCGPGSESAADPNAPWWLKHGWAVLAKSSDVGKR